MRTRAQLAFFVILGILIVLVMVAVFFVAHRGARDDLYNRLEGLISTPDYVEDVRSHVSGCLESVTREGIFLLAKQGGYFSPSNESDVFNIPRYVYKNKRNVPTKRFVENELASFIAWRLDSCVDDFETFPGLNVSAGRPVVDAELGTHFTEVRLDYPLVIEKGGVISNAKAPYTLSYPSKLGIMLEMSNEIVGDKIGNPGVKCLSCLYQLAEKNGLAIHFMDTSQGTIYIIRDERSSFMGEPLQFVFGIE